MGQSFYSNGKLLITGEYAVLDGALALAMPTKFGQHLHFEQNDSGFLKWTGVDEKNSIWFEQLYELDNFSPIKNAVFVNSDIDTTDRLTTILKQARALNPEFLTDLNGAKVRTQTDFNRKWGLGTSSTLINNIAQWAGIDAFELNRLTFGGSGYDIACAQYDRPLFYRLLDGKPQVQETDFQPPFGSQLYFVYLNKKMDSRKAIEKYRLASFNKDELAESISELSMKIASCTELGSFMEIITEHELIISEVLGIVPVKESLFPDYPGAVKSLGGWGGDFILAASDQEGPDYFNARSYDIVIPFEEMAL